MRKVILLMAMAVMGLSAGGCASKHMQPLAAGSVNQTLAEDTSAVVFLRATSFGGAIQAPVIEGQGTMDTDGQSVKYVGIVSSGAKLLHKTTTGKHFYVVGGESSSMLEADLQGGKTYYVKVEPKFGFAKARFILTPVPAVEVASPAFRKDFDWCEWYGNKPESQQWFRDNLPDLQKKYVEAAKKHRTGTKETRMIMTPEYGVAMPLK